MQKNIFLFGMLIILTLGFVACGGEKKDRKYYLQESTGRYNQVNVFTDSAFYNEQVFDVLADTAVFGRLFPGLLFPPESRLVSRNLDPSNFSKFRNSRSIMVFAKGKAGIDFVTDSTAKPQAFVVVRGETPKEQLAAIRFNADSLVSFFVHADHRAVIRNETKYNIKSKPFLDSLGLQMLLPETYAVVKRDKDFVWYRADLNADILNMLYYTVPVGNDSLGSDDLIQLRDIYSKRHIKGAKPGDHARTDTIFAPLFERTQSNAKQDVYMMRGIWSLKIGMLGGPFVTKFILDKQKKQLYVADAYVVAKHVRYYKSNKSKKRTYLMQIESLLTTFEQKE